MTLYSVIYIGDNSILLKPTITLLNLSIEFGNILHV